VDNCEHTDMTSVNELLTRDPVSDEEWHGPMVEKMQLYILYWTTWKHRAEFLTMNLYHSNWKATT